MRTTIDIDDALLREAMAATGARTKKEAVELGLRKLTVLHEQARIRELRGVGWGWEEQARGATE